MNDQSRRAEPKDPRFEAALREYFERLDRGERVDRETFLARHAEIADELRAFISTDERVERLARSGDSTRSFALHGQETIAPEAAGKGPGESSEAIAAEFGRYRIVRTLGSGAMGTVYLAEDTQLERQVALKMPRFEGSPTEELLERFKREAQAAAMLRNANICPVYDVGMIDGKHYLSMAYIEGHPLSAFAQSGKPQSERQILIAVRKLALALQEAHEHGVVHRDLKPANIMVDKRGEPIIMDFGLARQIHRDQNIRLTQSGMLIGTPAYMSPEQVEGEPDKIGPATDQYSLGVILYELLTNQLPFRGSMTAVIGQIVTKEPESPSQLRPEIDSRVEAACLKMMAKSPSGRFPSLAAAAEELAKILKTPAAKKSSKDGPTAHRGPLPAGIDRPRTEAGSPQLLKSAAPKAVTDTDLASLEELARKCLARHDYDQVIQIIERIPEERRNEGLRALLRRARDQADEIAYLICEIDEADRLNDRRAALKKADELLKITPGHYRALAVQKEFGGDGEGGAARIGALRRFTQPRNEGGRIPWSVLAFGLLVFGSLIGAIVLYLGRAAVVIDVRDPAEIAADRPDKTQATKPETANPVSATPQDGFVALFNGKDLTGWKTHPSQPGNWRVENGVLTGSGESVSHLYSERSDFKDFHLRAEARINQGGNSGLYFRASFGPSWPARTPRYPDGYEAQIDCTVDKARTGSLFVASGRTAVMISKSPVAAGEWFIMEVIARGTHILIKVNGEDIVEHDDAHFAKGHLALQERDRNTVAEFRRIEIKELQEASRSGHRSQVASLVAPFTESQSRQAQKEWAERLQMPYELTNSIGMTMSLIPPGSFTMGSRQDEKGRQEGENRVPVTLTKPFWLGQREVTRFQWRRVMRSMPWSGRPTIKNGPEHPAIYVNWADAEEFCKGLTKIERRAGRLEPGQEYVLPTEAQWEYACRAGTTTSFSFGDDERDLPTHGWFKQNALDVGKKQSQRVGLKQPNAWQLFDMHGNVWEWCRDLYWKDVPGGTDPVVFHGAPDRVIRGGGWDNPSESCRSARRAWRHPDERTDSIGFRVALSSPAAKN